MRTLESTADEVLPHSRAMRDRHPSGAASLRQDELGDVQVQSEALYLGPRSGENGVDGVVVRVPNGSYRVIATLDDRAGSPVLVAVSVVLSPTDEAQRSTLPGAAFWHEAPGDLPLLSGTELIVCDAGLRDQYRDPSWPWGGWLAEVVDPAIAEAGAAGRAGAVVAFAGRSETLVATGPTEGDLALFAGFDVELRPTALHLERLEAADAPPPWIMPTTTAAPSVADAPPADEDVSPFRRSTFQPPTDETPTSTSGVPDQPRAFGLSGQPSPFGAVDAPSHADEPASQGSFGAATPQGSFGAIPAQGSFGAATPQGSFGAVPAQSSFGEPSSDASPFVAPPPASPSHAPDHAAPGEANESWSLEQDDADRPIFTNQLGDLDDDRNAVASPVQPQPHAQSEAAPLVPSMPAAEPADPGAKLLVEDAVAGVESAERADPQSAVPTLVQVTEALAAGVGARPAVQSGLAAAGLSPAKLVDVLADALISTDRTDEAVARIRGALEAEPFASTEVERLHLQHRLGALQLRAGAAADAARTLEAARADADVLLHRGDGTADQARAYFAQITFDLAASLLETGNATPAAEFATDAMRTFEELEQPRMAGRSAFLAASAYDEVGHEASRQHAIAEAERIFRAGDEFDGLGTALGYLGEADARRGDYTPAAVKFEQARLVLERAGAFANAAVAAENEAVCFDYLGDAASATDRRREAARLEASAAQA